MSLFCFLYINHCQKLQCTKHFRTDQANSCCHEGEGSRYLEFKHRICGIPERPPRHIITTVKSTGINHRGSKEVCFASCTSLFTRDWQREKEHFAYQAELLLNSTLHCGYLQVSLMPCTTRAKTFRWWGWVGREECKVDRGGN